MEKVPMCRVCLAENVRMYVVVNKNLRELYEKLTDHPFVTEDSRPILACFFCCTKLKQCYQFQQKCLEAEELFAQMMNEDYEPNSLLNQDYREFCNGFIQSPMVHVSIVDECQTENIRIKEELPAFCERLDDIIVPKEEHQSDELELENIENSLSAVKDVPTQSDSEDDTPLMEFKVEVEEHEVSRNYLMASDTQRMPVAKKPKLEDVITEEQKKNEQSDTKVIRTAENCMFNTVTRFKEPLTDTKCGVNDFSLDTNCCKKAEIKCEKSNKFIVSAIINRHRSLRVKEKSFKCETCQRSFNQKKILSKHIRIHSGEKSFKCDVCQHGFKEKGNLIRHIRTHAREKPFKCEVCQRAFKEKFSLTRHIRLHTGEKPYECEVCQRCFTDDSNLRRHIRLHMGEKPFKCDVCLRCFSEKAHLTYHNRTHTHGEKPYKCDICQRSFNAKWNLKQHINIHAIKPFQCDICQRSFHCKGNLIQHIRLHSGEKLFKCDVCQRCFNHKHTLISHIWTHTGEKPYKCDVCGTCFRQKCALKRHIRIHTGEKPYKCEVCQRVFSEKISLNKHICKETSEPLKWEV